jgi:phage baseplate assembly protein gpV
MIDNLNDQDKPNYSGYFIGTVLFNEDPDKIERIKVTIPSLLQGDKDKLPWLGKKKAELFPDAKDGTFGTFGLVPAVGTQVIVSFQDANPLYGMYEACPHQSNERVAEALTNYLYRYGFKDPAGNLFMVDTKPGAVEILVQHKSGTLIRIVDNGDMEVIVVKDLSVNVTGNSTIQVSGNSDVTISGAATLSVAGGITSDTPTWNHTGNINITGKVTVTNDVVAAGISLKSHLHMGVTSGTSMTGIPV